MDRLYIMRHGVAVDRGANGVVDDDRRLTPGGKRKVQVIAQALSKVAVGVERILTSPLPRARETAEIVAMHLDLEGSLEGSDMLRPGSGASEIRTWLQGRPEGVLFIVGHDPALSELVGLIALGEPGRGLASLRKGGIAAFERGGDGKLRLDWLARPKLFTRVLEP